MKPLREEREDEAALKIQKLWRSYTNRKIYKYYRDIIFFKCKGNPAKLLKGINPLEATLLEPASGCHIRFRLGGQNFPPNIYYKIFSRTGIVDINAFAPRDYSSLPRSKPAEKMTLQDYKSRKEEYEEQGWYLRADNNGWRPISHKMFDKADYVEMYSANRVRYYHHKKEKRLDKCSKKARIAKLRWLQNIYKQEKQKKETMNADKQQMLEGQIAKAKQELEEEEDDNQIQVYNPLMNPKLVEIEDEDQFDREVEKLVSWSQNLDYDEYAREWFQLSTSESSAKYISRDVAATSNIIEDKKQ